MLEPESTCNPTTLSNSSVIGCPKDDDIGIVSLLSFDRLEPERWINNFASLKESPFIHSVEKCESGIFIYIEEEFLKDASLDEKTAWGESSLKQALKMLKDDFWPIIQRSIK